ASSHRLLPRVTASLRVVKSAVQLVHGMVGGRGWRLRVKSRLRRYAIALRDRRSAWMTTQITTRPLRPLPCRPLVSIILPTWETDPELLRRAVFSVQDQIYDNWELCICDDGSRRTEMHDTLKEISADERIRVEYLRENGG